MTEEFKNEIKKINHILIGFRKTNIIIINQTNF